MCLVHGVVGGFDRILHHVAGRDRRQLVVVGLVLLVVLVLVMVTR